jgi:hypothetical protein
MRCISEPVLQFCSLLKLCDGDLSELHIAAEIVRVEK